MGVAVRLGLRNETLIDIRRKKGQKMETREKDSVKERERERERKEERQVEREKEEYNTKRDRLTEKIAMKH